MRDKVCNTNIPAVVIILIIPLFIIGGVFNKNHVLLPADILSGFPAWKGAFPNQNISNGLASDAILQFYPWRKLAYENAQETGKFPLWNPYELTGEPLVANAQSALFYPPNLLLHWIRPEDVVAISAYFNFLLLGLGTFYLCREINLKRIASLFAALIAMISGTAIVYLYNPLVNSMAPLPLIILAGEKIVNGKRLIPWISAIGIGIGLSLLGGHPETTVHICLAFSMYFVARLISKKPGVHKGLLWLFAVFAGVVFGFIIGAIQWIPFLDFLLPSATMAEGGRSMGGTQIFYSKEWLYNLATSVTFLIPYFFGSPITKNYYWPFPVYQNFNEQTMYFGLIPLALSVPLIFNRKRQPHAMILIGICGLFLAIAWRLPVFEAVNHLPLFDVILNKRMRLFIPVMMAIVAGIGLNEWQVTRQSNRFENKYQKTALLPPLLSLTVFFLVGFLNIYISKFNIQNSSLQTFLEHLVFRVFNLNQPRIIISFVVPILFLLLCVLFWKEKVPPKFFSYSVFILTFTELIVLAWKYNPVVDRNLLFPHIPLISTVGKETQPFRTMSSDLMLFPPNAGSAYRIAQVEGYDLPIYQSFFDLYRSQGGAKASHRQVWEINFPLLDWLNIRYVISSDPIQKSGYRLVLDQEVYKVYQNDNAYPRAYMVYNYQVIEDKQKLLETMVSAPSILRDTALFNKLPNPTPAVTRPASEGNQERVKITNYGMDRVLIDAYSPQAGFLVMSDLYTADWKAKVDGVDSPILIVNYAYRSVYLTAGQHEVEFFYAPKSFYIAKITSVLGVMILFVLFISLLISKNKSPNR